MMHGHTYIKIFIDVRIIKEMPGSVASGTHRISPYTSLFSFPLNVGATGSSLLHIQQNVSLTI